MLLFIAFLTTIFSVASSQSDCGKQGSTTLVHDLDDVDYFQACSTFYGSLYLQTSVDAEYDNITMPKSLNAITGGLFCGGGGDDTTTSSINAQDIADIASDPTEPTVNNVGFVIVDYPALSSLAFPNLAVVGSNFIIAQNPKLTTIQFPSLRSIRGNLDVTGNFQVLDLPSLSLVNGSVNIQTSSGSFSCPLFASVAILGTYECSVGTNNPQPLTQDDPSTNPNPINEIAASSVSSRSLISVTTVSSTSSSVSYSITSISTTSSSESQNPGSSSPTSGSTASPASSTRISVISLAAAGLTLISFFLI